MRQGAAPDLRLDPDAACTRQRLTERADCLIFDQALSDPEALVAWAASRRGEFFMPERAYPGLVLPLGDEEAGGLHAFVRSRLSREFRFLREGTDTQSQLSLVTLHPEDLGWCQRLPHAHPHTRDGRMSVALTLYLFEDPLLGGTGFYRWRDPELASEIAERQQDEGGPEPTEAPDRIADSSLAPVYTTDSNEAVELIAHVPARFNRLVAYPGDVPHAAFIRHPERLTTDPTTGRLTLNCFARTTPLPDSEVPIG
ncbi:MAG: DUF6445 family protein [Gammaproteobacteria bacterium]